MKCTGWEGARSHCLVLIMRNDVERSSLSFFFFFFFSSRLAPCAIASSRQREITNAHATSLKGTMTGSLASTSFSFMPRESDVTRNEVPPGDFGTGSFSRRHAIAPLPLLVLVVRTSYRLSHHVATRRDSAATTRSSAMHSNANISRPGDTA